MRSHCREGHELTPDNVYVQTLCKPCHAEKTKQGRSTKREAVSSG